MLASTGEPSNISEALDDNKWNHAMQEESDALIKNKTWHLVPPSSGKNLIDCNWIYRIKKNADGTIQRYKARFVAKGFKQHDGIDYEDTDTSQTYLYFLMLYACSYTICLVFCYTSWHFYAFFRTNLLTRCHSASSLFSAVFVFQKSYTRNILRIG
jgi:hypothetical protein